MAAERIIQHTQTEQYLDEKGGWTSDRKAAARFQNVHEGIAFCRDRGITKDVQLLVLLEAGTVRIELFPG